VQHRAKTQERGRHRRTAPLHSHRAPATPFGERGRYAMLTAALVAGVGVAGVSAATAGAAPSHPGLPGDAQAAVAAARPTTTAHPSADRTAVAHTSPAPDTASLTGVEQAMADRAAAALTPASPQTPAPSLTAAALAAAPALPASAFNRVQQKERPVPVVRWVNPLPEAAVTSCFGQRWGRLHAGVDLAAPDGTRIMAAGAGTVVLAGVEAGYGNAVLIDHGNGFLTHYGHMSVIGVKVGQQVAAGQEIGNEGSTGHSTGPHLHFEVHQGTYKNPIEPTQWMREHGVDIPGCVTSTK
jgi:murein DD-endopeptidase MepM/ murein hydrolase activator NlpD